MAKKTSEKVIENVDVKNVDGVNNDATSEEIAEIDNSSSVVDFAAIDFKKLKLRGLPKGLTIDAIKEIVLVVDAIKKGEPNNTESPYNAFCGFELSFYREFMEEPLLQQSGVDCVILRYIGRSRVVEMLVAVNNKFYKIIATTSTQYPVFELVQKGFKGVDVYGYADSSIRSLRNANDAGEKLIGTIAYNHICEKNFCVDTICSRQNEKKFWKKTRNAIYSFVYQDDGTNNDNLDEYEKQAMIIDYREIDKINDYLVYLRGIIKDSDKEYSESQKAAAKAILAKIGA